MLQLIGVGVGAFLIGSPPYILSYHLAHNSLDFASGMIGPATMWTLKMRIGRFVYKGLYLFGPLAWLLLAFALPVRRKWPVPSDGSATDYRARANPIFAGIVLFNLLLFFRFSIEISYLIPAAFFSLLLLGMTLLAKDRLVTVAFMLAIVSLNLVTPQLGQPNIPGRSTDAKLHFALRPGEMIEDVHQRFLLRNCVGYDYGCYLRNRGW